MHGGPVPELKEYRRLGCWLFAAVVLAGCGRDPEFRMPAVPARAPIETRRLNSNVFDSICRIGNPFAVVGWDLDPQTRFLYFVGPFTGADDGLTHPYLYMAIPAPDRDRMNTELYLDKLDEAELRKHAKSGELRRFLLPHIAGLAADVDEMERQLGPPTQRRELKSGLTRLVFEREVCLNDKRLVGVYVDVDDGRLVAAKGVDHPERLKWIASGGRPPQPDDRPTWYLDWNPREGSPQAAAMAFVHRLEGRNIGGAREQLAPTDPPSHPIEELAALFGDGASIDSSTLTYRTTRYELDLTEVAIAFKLSNGHRLEPVIELRDFGDGRWLVTEWRNDLK